jgi:hypothetical protein
MKIKIESQYERRIGLRQWHRWFAWHPVRVGDGDVRWLEAVERRLVWNGFFGYAFEYLPVGQEVSA